MQENLRYVSNIIWAIVKHHALDFRTEQDYNENMQQIKDILKGNISSVIDHLKDMMVKYSAELRFEEAQMIKEKIEILSRFRSRSTVVSNTIRNVDVFGIARI